MHAIKRQYAAPTGIWKNQSDLLPTRYADQELDHLERMIKFSCAARLTLVGETADISYWEGRLRVLSSQVNMIPSQHARVQRLLDYLSIHFCGSIERSASRVRRRKVRPLEDRQYELATSLECEERVAHGPAKAEILSGCYWKPVADRYDIKAQFLLFELEEIAAYGPALADVLKGGDWRKIADQHGIETASLCATLENSAADGAKVEVLSGLNWKTVADRRGISTAGLRAGLESIAAHGLATREVMAGANWCAVADRHSIASPSLRASLEKTSALGPARKEVLLGHCWHVVAEQYGIVDLSLMALLSDAQVRPIVVKRAVRRKRDATAHLAHSEMNGVTTIWQSQGSSSQRHPASMSQAVDCNASA
jgi:hypothetical protein